MSDHITQSAVETQPRVGNSGHVDAQGVHADLATPGQKDHPNAFSFLTQRKALQLCEMGNSTGEVSANDHSTVACQCDYSHTEQDMVSVSNL